jgi:hypothetical protein
MAVGWDDVYDVYRDPGTRAFGGADHVTVRLHRCEEE